jgi:hypothetical protein
MTFRTEIFDDPVEDDFQNTFMQGLDELEKLDFSPNLRK